MSIKCPDCGKMFQKGGVSDKIYYMCDYCKSVVYKEDLDKDKKKKQKSILEF